LNLRRLLAFACSQSKSAIEATMTIKRALPRLFILAVAAMMAILLASRLNLIDLPRKYDPLAVPDLDETPHWLTNTQLKLVDLEPANCQAALARAGLPTTFRPAKGMGTSCEVSSAVTLTRLSEARLRSEDTRCNIAARLYMWEKHIVQKAARRHFGEPVTEILHFGSYSCRTIAGSDHMSHHANANAIDISGFRLRNGITISVLKDWGTRGPEAVFLNTIHNGACDYFNTTLGPDYNAAHRDHFHLDMGWYRTCR
jgi:hypothetical protein